MTAHEVYPVVYRFKRVRDAINSKCIEYLCVLRYKFVLGYVIVGVLHIELVRYARIVQLVNLSKLVLSYIVRDDICKLRVAFFGFNTAYIVKSCGIHILIHPLCIVLVPCTF